MRTSRNSSPISDRHSRGQVFIILALAFLAIMAFVGLAVDAGLAFIAYGKLARAVDAAALSAAAQFREGRQEYEMVDAAENAMAINGIDVVSIDVDLCDYSLPEEDRDPQLCPTIRKKLVRITATAEIPLAFLRILGFNTVSLSASAVAEAASLDVVLVLDISESMAFDGDPDSADGNMLDPSVCNNADPSGADGYPGECQPFEEVKSAASDFVRLILDKADPIEEEDRLAIVTFGNGWSDNPNMGTFYRTAGWTSSQSDALAIIRDLKIVEPPKCFDDTTSDYIPAQEFGPCRRYDTPDTNNYGNNNKLFCISCILSNDEIGYYDNSGLTTTNIGGGLLRAGNMFAVETREDALWVVILLTDGLANATDPDRIDDITDYGTYPMGYCPPQSSEPWCLDTDVYSRHNEGDADYDADDYARDQADFVGCYPINQAAACGSQQGQGAVIFTIGLGNGVLDAVNEVNGRPYGTSLLRYIAAVGDDGNAATDPCEIFDTNDPADWQEWCGNYYYSPGTELSEVFEDIASRVFTRLAR